MKKIDLHIHTQKCKKGDGDSRKIEPDDFINKMLDNNIGICSITNHNKFDINEYNYISSKISDFLIFPGIELDVRFKDNIRHIILVCNPNCASKFKSYFSDDDKRNYDEYAVEYNQFKTKLGEFKYDEIIIIPHFYDKDEKKSITEDEKKMLEDDLPDFTIILEPKLKSMGIINAHNEIALIGSDIKDWSKYNIEAEKLPNIKFEFDSFGKFYELASSPNLFIKTVIKDCEKVEINLDESNKLDIYKDINVIFGGKGSGKTKLLKEHILPKLNYMGKTVCIHEGKDYQKAYDEIIESIKSTIEIDINLKDSIINALNNILEYREDKPSNFIDKYLQCHECHKKNKNAQIIKKKECTYHKSIHQKNTDVYIESNSYLTQISNVEAINDKYRNKDDDHHLALSEELNCLKKDIYKYTVNQSRDIFSVSNTNNLIENIKNIIQKKTGVKSKPNNLGFSSLVAHRLGILNNIKCFKKNLKEIESKKKIKIGHLPDKGDIFVEARIAVLDKDEKFVKGSPFDRNKISYNRDFMRKITEFKVENINNINMLLTTEEKQKKANEYFDECIKITCDIVKDDNSKYEPSEGEKSILSISGLIENTTYECYLFDEIERGLGNKYISEYIIDKLKYLRDIGKFVVVSTHNANIAVNTLPTQTIFCNYKGKDDEEIYFAGNMYDNHLISIKNNHNVIPWDKEAIQHLEGSEDMFCIRRNIWNQ